jgi:two-component system, sensor histidine kinase YesM
MFKFPLNFVRAFRRNIKYKLFLVYLLVISLSISIFGIISFYMSSNVVISDYIKYNERINTQIVKNIDENISNLTRQSMSVYSNLDDVLYILNTTSDKLDQKYLDTYSHVYNYFVSILQGNTRLYGISLISLDGEIKFYYNRHVGQTNLYTVQNDEWFKETLKNNGVPILREPHINEFNPDKNMVISISRAIVNLDNEKVSGLLLFDQDINQFSQLFSDIETEAGEMIIVFGKNGKSIYSNMDIDGNASENIFKATNNQTSTSFYYQYQGKKMLASFDKSSAYGWTVITLTPMSDLQKKSDFIKKINYFLLPFMIIFTLIISIIISSLITLPLKRLMASFILLQKGDFDTSVEVKGTDELAQIGFTFNNMVKNIKDLIFQKYEMNIIRKQAELESLQSQINPHFLFNTLNSIKAVSENHDFEKTSIMLQNLSDIFRYSLNKGVYMVSFSDELENVKKYIDLQNLRYADRYSVIYDIDEEVLRFKIPRLTLQPIVENAIYHGLEKISENGELSIAAKSAGEKFFIYISNNGSHIPKEELDKINLFLESNPDEQKNLNPESIGIYNVNARIKFHFGNEYGLKIFSTPGSNTTVKISLPAAY